MVSAFPFPGPIRAWTPDNDTAADWVKVDPAPPPLYVPLPSDSPRRAFDGLRKGQERAEDKAGRRPRSKLGLTLGGLGMPRKARTEQQQHPPLSLPQQQTQPICSRERPPALPLPQTNEPPASNVPGRACSPEQAKGTGRARQVRPMQHHADDECGWNVPTPACAWNVPTPACVTPTAAPVVDDSVSTLGRRVMGLRASSGVSSWRGVKQHMTAALKGGDKGGEKGGESDDATMPVSSHRRPLSTTLGRSLRRVASSEHRETMGYRRDSTVPALPAEAMPRVAFEGPRRAHRPGSVRSFMTTGHYYTPSSAPDMPERPPSATPPMPSKKYAASVYTASSYALPGSRPLPQQTSPRAQSVKVLPVGTGSNAGDHVARATRPSRNPLRQHLRGKASSMHHVEPPSRCSSPASMKAQLPPQLQLPQPPTFAPLSLHGSSSPLPPVPPIPQLPVPAPKRVPSLTAMVSAATNAGSRTFPAPNIDEILVASPVQESPPHWPESSDGGLSPLSATFAGGGRTPSISGSIATSIGGSVAASITASMCAGGPLGVPIPTTAGWHDSARPRHLAPARRVWRDDDGKEVRAVYKVGYERPVLDAEARLHETMYDVAGGRHSFIGGDPASVLDLGTGTGLWPIWAATQWPNARIVGVDLVPVHIDVAELAAAEGRRRTSAAGEEEDASMWSKVASRIQFHHYNFLDGLPYPAGEFDIVHIRFLGLGVPETRWAALVDEAVRVLRPGGMLEIWEMSYEPPPGTAPCVSTAYAAALLADVVHQNPLHALQLNMPGTAGLVPGSTRPVFQISWPAARDGSTARTTEPGAPASAPAALLDAAPAWIRSVLSYSCSGLDAIPCSDTGARAAAALAAANPDRWGARFRDDDGTPPPPVPKECPTTPTSPTTAKKTSRPNTLTPNPAAGSGRIALAAWVATKA